MQHVRHYQRLLRSLTNHRSRVSVRGRTSIGRRGCFWAANVTPNGSSNCIKSHVFASRAEYGAAARADASVAGLHEVKTAADPIDDAVVEVI